MSNLVFDKNTFVPYEKPPEIGKWEAAKLKIWNSKESTVLGRTCTSWAKILSFYLCFYTALAALYAICAQGLFYTLSDQHPTYLLDESLIGSNPGLGFRPISETVDIDGSLIWYTASNESQCKTWVDRTDQFLEPYRTVEIGGGQNIVLCDYNTPPPKDHVCAVDVKNWAPCNSVNGYGYNRSSPCIFLKLNRIYGWEPDFYKDVSNLPSAMPEDLRNVISKADNNTLSTVWLSCTGENPSDRENMGPIEYYPQQGFPSFYYPYVNTPGYLSPLVAIRLARPKRNVLINIECRAWANNIKYSHSHGVREGSVHFEVIID